MDFYINFNFVLHSITIINSSKLSLTIRFLLNSAFTAVESRCRKDKKKLRKLVYMRRDHCQVVNLWASQDDPSYSGDSLQVARNHGESFQLKLVLVFRQYGAPQKT